MTGTTGEASLHQQLLKECKKTSHLIHLSHLMQTQNLHPKKRRVLPVLHDPEKKEKKIQDCLLSLCEEPTCQEAQTEENILQLIQPAAAAAAAAQAQPPNTDQRPEKKTETFTTANRCDGMNTFKPGFEQETEWELSLAFKRPPRKFKHDPPFYPWLPPEPRVNFQLNYQF